MGTLKVIRCTEESSVFEGLRGSGLESWAITCLILLDRLYGLERVIEDPDHTPLIAIRSAIEHAIAAPDDTREAQLLKLLSTLPVFDYQVRARKGDERWQPLRESLARFQERHDNQISHWQDWEQQPSPEEVVEWLQCHRG